MHEDVYLFQNAPLILSANCAYCENSETNNILCLLIILTTHAISRCVLHTKNAAILLFNVFYHYKYIVFCRYHTLVLLREMAVDT